MIKFILNDKIINTSANSGMTLLDFIRENAQLKGTKIGCREGDCGACTVLVGTLVKDEISYHSITSCISPLGNANGKHIVTVEGLNLPDKLNTIQQSISDNYATQCGFCTPGIVVSLAGHALHKHYSHSHSHNSSKDAISGNICRCTGYKSIEKASDEIEDKLSTKDHQKPIEWLIKEEFIPSYFKDISARLANLQLDEIGKTGVTVANGTDLYVQQADRLANENMHLIANEASLKGISFENDKCIIGASTTVSEIMQNERLRTIFPKLKSFLKLVSSEQIRNMGTLGGNFVNASPIGDMTVFFLALNSTLSIRNETGTLRQIPLHNFHQDYKKYDLQKGELIQSLSFNIPDSSTLFNFEKVSKRTHLDIASVNTACEIRVENNFIAEAHLSIGGVAAIPKYLDQTNKFLHGKAINSETITEAEKILQSEISPISDVRGTKEYKRLLARQLFFAHFIELFPNEIEFEKLIIL